MRALADLTLAMKWKQSVEGEVMGYCIGGCGETEIGKEGCGEVGRMIAESNGILV